MAYKKTFKLNGADFAQYVHEDGPQVTNVSVKGLPDEYTEDNKKHIDIRGRKDIYTYPFNPTSEAETRAIKNACAADPLWLTAYDTDIGADRTFPVEVSPVQQDPAFEEDGVKYFQLAPITFSEL